ncbi:hypothetical protein [Rhodoferax ferrireducens]|uniref:hypothetical protein n=1 Tax=Rhodoferax ferrireducens TaxID=192843 RepID=UPI000E0D3813|nr:hypothetical protein [Rhodoferax ferrireducens]
MNNLRGLSDFLYLQIVRENHENQGYAAATLFELGGYTETYSGEPLHEKLCPMFFRAALPMSSTSHLKGHRFPSGLV